MKISLNKKIAILFLVLLCLIQSTYLVINFYKFSWENTDDLLTLTLIDQNNYEDLIIALKSGLNVFPPFYFLFAYLLVEVFQLPKEILLYAHIPLLWLSILLTYKLFRSFTNRQIASFSTISTATIKSAFLTQSIYVRPYCLYYCASLATVLTAINFQKKHSKLNFFFYWTAFQVLTHSHYYGLPIGMLVSIPLLFSKLSNRKKCFAFIITLSPSLLTYAYILPKQLSFLFFAGTTGDTSFGNILAIYKALSFPAIFVFGVILLFSFFNRDKVFLKINVPISLLLLWVSPLIITFILSLTFGEGTYYRYFVPSQIGIVAFGIWIVSLIRPFDFSTKSSSILITISLLLLSTWSIRNIATKKIQFEKNHIGSMDFDQSIIKDMKIPFLTSHLETFLKISHDSNWPVQSFLLRTDKDDFIELPKFNKLLTPISKDELTNLNHFIYHFYYSGPHSLIDFKPNQWADKNDYRISEISQYPLVLRFTRD